MNIPKRPNSKSTKELFESNAFMMDFENSCLSDWFNPIPTGNRRFENPEWRIHILKSVYPHHSDIDWHEYCAWVSQGGGDDFFQDEVNDHD
jgi:hypothetical protein